MASKHIIDKQIINLDVSDKETVQELFSEISRLFNNRIADITSAVFDAHIKDEAHLKLDRLEIDLGSVSYPFSQEDLADQYRDALENALLQQLKLLKDNPFDSNESPSGLTNISPGSYLEHYLLTGTIPWWASAKEYGNPQAAFDQLLSKDAPALKVLISKLAQNQFIRKRIVYHLSSESIHAIIRLFQPQEAAFIIEYHHSVSLVQQKQQAIQAERSVFEKAVWEFILDFLFGNFASQFSRKVFVRDTIHSMSLRFNVSFARLLYLFSAAYKLPVFQLRDIAALPEIILELTEEFSYSASESLDPAIPVAEEGFETTARSAQTKLELIRFYLYKGYLPVDHYFLEPAEMEELFLSLLTDHRGLVANLITEIGDTEMMRKRLVRDFGETTAKKIIRILEPSNSEAVINYVDVSIRVQRSRSLIKVEESDFRLFLWQFILGFIAKQKGSVFNMRSFVESSMLSQANHYNIDYQVLVSFLIQGIGEEKELLADNNDLFFILINILKEIHGTGNTHSSDEVFPGKTTELSELLSDRGISLEESIPERPESLQTERRLLIRNAILYWMEHGTFPWWFSTSNNRDPIVLLDELLVTAPTDVMVIFKYAVSKDLLSSHVFSGNATFFYTLLEQAADGPQALSFIDLLMQPAFTLSAGLQESEVRLIIYLSIIDSYKYQRFSSFDASHFFSAFLHRIHSSTGISVEKVQSLLIRSLNAVPQSQLRHEALHLLKDTVPSGLLIHKEFAALLNLSKQEAQQILGLSDDSGVNGNSTTTCFQILEYYFQHHQLPSHIKGISSWQTDDLVYRLLILLNQSDTVLFRRLFTGTSLSSVAAMHVHDLFQAKNTPEANPVKSVLVDFFERDLLAYVSETITLSHSEARLKDVLQKILLLKKGTKNTRSLLILFQSSSFRSQAALRYSGTDFMEVIAKLGAEKHIPFLKRMSYVIQFFFTDSFEREHFEKNFREFSFSWFTDNGSDDVSSFLKSFLRFIYQRKNWNMSRLSAQINAAGKKANTFSGTDMNTLLAEFHSLTQDYAATPPLLLQEEKLNKPVSSLAEEKEESKTNVKEKEEAKKKLLLDQIQIRNAGLVLLHPFLPTLFVRTGLMLAGSFTTEDARSRAPYLLQYLVKGTEGAEEHELALNKILCGIAPEEVLPGNVVLTEVEKAVSADLINNVILSWDKIKNTSVEGLRASFFEREGALMLTEDMWMLKVEARGYDILLQTLPWGMSLIKTSWMEKPITVEWI